MRTALPLGPNDALLVGSLRFVHAFGAAAAVDVLLDRRRRIIKIERIERGRARFHLRGVAALVVGAGVAERLALAPAQVLKFEEDTVGEGRDPPDCPPRPVPAAALRLSDTAREPAGL